MNRITLLLLDDQPFVRDHRGIAILDMEDSSNAYVEMLKRCYHLLWLRTPTEMRAYYYLTRAIVGRDARALASRQTVPEVVIFDFALTSRTTSRPPLEVDRGDSFPLPELQKLLVEVGGDSADISGQPLPRSQDVGYDAGSDRFGCYAGGLICLEFSDYCTVGVPTTQYTSSHETFFFEWFLERPLRGLFDKKSRSAPTWHELLSVALPALRQRIEERVRAGTLRVDVGTFLSLASRISEEDQNVLVRLQSRFGEKVLSIGALFADLIFPDPSANAGDWTDDCTAEVRRWTKGCLDNIIAGLRMGREVVTTDDLEEARTVAARYWEAHLSDRCSDRYDLSEFVSRPKPTPETRERIGELCKAMGLDPEQAIGEPRRTKVPRGEWAMRHWKGACASDLAARWAALFVAVRAERDCTYSHPVGLQLLTMVSKVDREQGVVERENLESRVGSDELARITSKLKLRTSFDQKATEYLELPVRRAAEVDDILVALDPLPTQLLTYLNRGKDPSEGRTTLTNALKRLGKTARQLGFGSDGNWGSLGLSLSDVLAGAHHECAWCEQVLTKGSSQLEEHPNDEGAHGLRAGEGLLLKAYADEIEFPESQWPAWLKNAP